ncbi:hypothetical protein WJX81_003106 [Elliptochloris bilobata]|uniref:Secreted protein n=1 Tax=Elliptochloris bilobata TaxID=381761 RepID=A0AAW1RXH4_9CHLO
MPMFWPHTALIARITLQACSADGPLCATGQGRRPLPTSIQARPYCKYSRAQELQSLQTLLLLPRTALSASLPMQQH